VTALDELEKRLDGPGLIVALTKDEARDLLSAALASDHFGNSTTMVPTLGVARIKAIIWKHWRNQNGQTLEDRFTAAAEEIADLTPRI